MKKLYFLLFLFLVGCGAEKRSEILTIPLEYGVDKVAPFEESGLDYSYEIIPLKIDTSNIESYVNQSHRLISYKNFIYLLSVASGPKIFTSDGDYVKSLSYGNGPGELDIYYNDIYIDAENDNVEVSGRGKISKFTLTGDFIEKTSQNIICSDICKIGDYTLRYYGMPSVDTTFIKIENHTTGEVVTSMFSKAPNSGFSTAQGRFMRNKKNVYFNIPFTQEIIKISDRGPKISVFMMIDNLLRYDECPDINLFKMAEYSDVTKKNCMIEYLSVSDDESIISFRVSKRGVMDRDNIYRVIFDKNNNRITHYPIKSMDIIFSNGEYDYAIAYPERILNKKDTFSESEKPLMNKLCEVIEKNGLDTNPYIVKIKIERK